MKAAFLRQLGGVIDMTRDSVYFSKLGVDVEMVEADRGHCGIPFFDFGFGSVDVCAADCSAAPKPDKGTRKEYNISKLEGTILCHDTQEHAGPKNSAICQAVLILIAMTSPTYAGATEDMKEVLQLQNVHQYPDTEANNRRNPVDPKTQATQGKYKGKSENYGDIYQIDKGYVKWIRSHITTKSHVEMQRLKLYILSRDMMKKQRVTEEMDSQEHMSRQEVIPPMAKKKNVRPRDDMEWTLTPTSHASSEDKEKIQLTPEEKAKLKAWLEGQ